MLNDTLSEFLQHLKYERNVSPHTLRNYTSDLEQFRDHLLKIEKRDDIPVAEIDRLTIREWMASLHSADKIRTPLLVVQGQNDPRVKRAESDQIVVALRDRGFPVEYLVAPDEGHGFARPVNNMAMIATTEAFLARHLGGRAQTDMPADVATRLKEITVDPKAVTLMTAAPSAGSAAPTPAVDLAPMTARYTATIDAGGQSISMKVAQEVREGCVAESLDLLQDLADRLGPLAYATSTEELLAGGCESDGEARAARIRSLRPHLSGAPLAVPRQRVPAPRRGSRADRPALRPLHHRGHPVQMDGRAGALPILEQEPLEDHASGSPDPSADGGQASAGGGTVPEAPASN